MAIAANMVNLQGKIFVGIDVHKKTYAVTVLDGYCIKKKVTMAANPSSLIAFLKNNYPKKEVNTTYEAGFSGFCLHRKLLDSGVNNIVINPSSIELASNNRVKTDKKDSNKLAEHLLLGRLNGINIPTVEQENKRLISRTRDQLLALRVKVGNQIKNKLFQFGLIDSEDDRVMSKKYLSSLVDLKLSYELKVVINCLSSTWIYLSSQIKIIDDELKKQAKADSDLEKVYQSVPGIGPISSRILANELGNMEQFKNERTLFSFVGLTPVEYSSGENIRQGHISRQGSSRLRRVLVECAWSTISKDESLKEVFDRISSRRGKKRAIVAVARRLIGKIRSCFKNNTLYKVHIDKDIKS